MSNQPKRSVISTRDQIHNIHHSWVVRKAEIVVHRINHYPVNSVVCFVNTYPLTCVAGERSRRAAEPLYPPAGPRGNSRAANSTFLQSSRDFVTRFATKTKALSRNPASYAGYYPLDSNLSDG